MSLIKILLISIILLAISLSGMFFKILFTKNNKNSKSSLGEQGIGCGCGSGACCNTPN